MEFFDAYLVFNIEMADSVWRSFAEAESWYGYPFYLFVAVVWSGAFVFLPLCFASFLIWNMLIFMGVRPLRIQKHLKFTADQKAKFIVSSFGKCMQQYSAFCIHDERLLPHPKTEIFDSLVHGYRNVSFGGEMEVYLEMGMFHLCSFQKHVGKKTLYKDFVNYADGMGLEADNVTEEAFSELSKKYKIYKDDNENKITSLEKIIALERKLVTDKIENLKQDKSRLRI